MIDVTEIQSLAEDIDNIIITNHMYKRLSDGNIKFDDVQNVLLYGEIIEQYPNDYPYPSCLELGTTINNKPLHICVGLGKNKLWIITGYYPKLDKWENDLKTRKG